MEICVYHNQDFPATEFLNALVLGKKPSKAGRSDCRLIPSYGNSGYSIRIFTDVCFAYKVKEIKHR